MGRPSWPNHAQILVDISLELVPFEHARGDGTADLDAVLAAIAGAGPSDAVLLHAACHNPTGIDYTDAEWDAIAHALASSGEIGRASCRERVCSYVEM